MNTTLLLDSGGEGLRTGLVGINKSNLSFITIEDLSDLFEGRTLSFDVEEGDEEKFDEDPDLSNISTWPCLEQFNQYVQRR